MAYRNGIYVAFDGLGTTCPIEGDIKYFNLLKGWCANKKDDFLFSDSHQKTGQVKDSSSKERLRKVLRTRLLNSKTLVLILTDKTRYDREMLNYEIDIAVNLKIPIIVCYAGISYPIYKPNALSSYWPKSLKSSIENDEALCIHIPFRKMPIKDAISQFSIHKSNTLNSKSVYSEDAYRQFGLVA